MRSANKSGIVDRLAAVSNRLKSRRSFSLAETLLAVLIMLLVSVIVMSGMPAATNAYDKVVLAANAKTMLSSAVTALHDEIGTAWDVKPIEGGLSYYSASTGALTKLIKNDEGQIWVEEYASLNNELIHDLNDAELVERHEKKDHLLISDSALGMYVTCGDNDDDIGIHYDDKTGIVSVSGLKVCKKTFDNTMLTQFVDKDGKPKAFTIRVISGNHDGSTE